VNGLSVRSILAAVKGLVLRLLFLHAPKYLYHYSKLSADKINTGFIFQVNTQGRMYALDLEFGHSTVSSGTSTVVTYSGRAVEKFVRHNPLYYFGCKLFWGHFITPRMGDVRFTSVKYHDDGLVEVDDFEIIDSLPTFNSNQVFKVVGTRLAYCLILLSGPALAIAMIQVSSPWFPSEYYKNISQMQWVLWCVFGLGFAYSMWSWVREYISFGRFRRRLEVAGLVCMLPFAYRMLIVFWACILTGLWVLSAFCYVLVPWVWLLNLCFFE
jgi:hypothetical protein